MVNFLKKGVYELCWEIKQKFGLWKQGIRTVTGNFESPKWCIWIHSTLLSLNVNIVKMDYVISVIFKNDTERLPLAGVKAGSK